MVASSIPSALDAWRDVIHPAALILPRPNPTEYAELKRSVEAHGLLSPLSTFVDKQGEHWLLDGVSRLQVLVELDKPVLDAEGRWAVATLPYFEEQGADPYEIALSLNITRRHLTPEQKRDVIRALREERPELSDRAIARMAGASPHTVADERRHQEAEAETTIAEPDDSYTEGTIEPEADGEDAAPAAADAPAAPEPVVARPAEPAIERREESGRKARGRKPGKQLREPKVTLPTQPFLGTVLPSAARVARVAEVKRCAKYLRLTVEVRPGR